MTKTNTTEKTVKLELDTPRTHLSKGIYRAARGMYALLPLKPVNVKLGEGVWKKEVLDFGKAGTPLTPKQVENLRLLRARGNAQSFHCTVTGEEITVFTWFRDTELTWTVRPEVFIAQKGGGRTTEQVAQKDLEAFA